MGTLPRRVRQIIKNDGIITLVRKGLGLLYRKLHRLYLFNIKKEIVISVGDADCTFVIDDSGDLMHFNSTYNREKPVYEDILSRAKPNTTFYDIGSNIGTYSCLVGDIARRGYVVAVEPLPENVDKIEKNFKKNNIDGQIFPGALSNSTGTQKLAVGIDGSGYGVNGLLQNKSLSNYYKDKWGSEKRITVNTFRGDELIDEEGLPLPDIVKIDVEGAEFEVIKGLQKTLSKNPETILYVEVHDPELIEKYGHVQSDIDDLVRKMGYDIERIQVEGNSYYLKCEN